MTTSFISESAPGLEALVSGDPAGFTGALPAILGVGMAVPPESFTQQEVLEYFGIEDRRVRSVFLNSAIGRRYLTLPPVDAARAPGAETQGELLAKHKTVGVALGAEALRGCLQASGLELADVGYLCCVTTTGMLVPGLSALLIKELGLDAGASRLDVVGMGCCAGLNALTAVAGWSRMNPGRVAVMVCVEVASAAYVFDGTIGTSVVNSLFGDGAAAVAVSTGQGTRAPLPQLVKFSSHIITDAIDSMSFTWDDSVGKYDFYLSLDVPYVVGANAETAVARLLDGTGIRLRDVAHWVVHSGGKKVADSLRVNLGLTHYDVRHTMSVLHDYGNLSSGSFLYSYQRLMDEGVTRPGEYGVMMTMGPGSTIETALVRF